MKSIANFIVAKRKWILGVMLCLTAVCVLLSSQVSINTDMTKYLPDDSSMKIGMNIMEDEFPEMEISSGIRVMAEGLDDAQKDELLAKLEALPYVDSVAHDDSVDYNKDPYSLFVISTPYDYGSEEELSIENALESDFFEYHIIYQNNNDSFEGMSPILLITAVAILMVILFVMSESWFEPILFLLTIGFAVLINSGTNIILGEISNITSSITAILQLVLSMDYSIILINRYRQEKQGGLSNQQAMAAALEHAFGSIASSSLTTVAGLLALVFMDFKIGVDLGIVLAKGVFISMVCVITILPCLILMCDKLITKTAKRALHIPMGGVARFSYRFRYVMLMIFVVAFFGFNHLQGNTQIAYTLETEDPIAEIFPSDNMLVMVYDNQDEAKVAQLAESLENTENVKQVLGYPNLLGKPHTAQELSGAMEDLSNSLGAELGDAADLDPALLELIYYHYYDGKTIPLTMSQFLQFLSEDVLTNDAFVDAIDEEMREQADLLADFADPAQLTTPKSTPELADFFDMDAEAVENLLIYYYSLYDGIDTGTMTLSTFASFVVDEVANDPDYSSLFDSDTLSEMERLKTFTDVAAVTRPTSYMGIANLLGMDADTVKLLFVYYYAMSESYTPGAMTLPVFVDFLQSDVMNDPMFSSYLDEGTKAQIGMLAQFTDKTALQAQRTPAELAPVLGMDEAMVNTIFALHSVPDVSGKTMTLAQFTGFLNDSILANPMFAASFDDVTKEQLQQVNGLIQMAVSGQEIPPSQLPEGMEQLVQIAASSTELDAATLGGMFGLDESMSTLIFRLYFGGASGSTMSLEELVDFILSDLASDPVLGGFLDDTTIGQLQMMQGLMKATISETAFTPVELAAAIGMDSGTLKMLFTYHDAQTGAASGWRLSLRTVIDFLLKNSDTFSSMMGAAQLRQLSMVQRMINASINGTAYTAQSLASLIGMDAGQMEQLYLLYSSKHGNTDTWQIPVQTLVDFLNKDVLTNPDYADLLDEDAHTLLAGAKELTDAVVSGEEYSAEETFRILSPLSGDLDKDTVELLYFYHASQTSADPEWTLTIQQLIDHMCGSVLDDPRFAAFIDADMRGQLADAQETLTDGVDMLKTDSHSRMLLYTKLPIEPEETMTFISDLNNACADFAGDYHLIGNSAMNYEMQQTFDDELRMITLLTSIAIFLIVMLSFRSLVIPLLLVLLVQCSVYITVTVVGVQGYSIYFLALLIVECILMGATIDYGILFTNYYRENRKGMMPKDALSAAYQGSIHTIMTSGLIIVLVTGILGYTTSDPTIGQIARTISTGALCAILMILFVLPGMLAGFDKLIVRKKDSYSGA